MPHALCWGIWAAIGTRLCETETTEKCVWVDDKFSAAHAEGEKSVRYSRREDQERDLSRERLDDKTENETSRDKDGGWSLGSNN